MQKTANRSLNPYGNETVPVCVIFVFNFRNL